MKSLQYYITERRKYQFHEDILSLAKYIINSIDNAMDENGTIENESELQINFDEIPEFDYDVHKPIKLCEIDDDYSCDLLVYVTKDAPDWGGMHDSEPILELNAKHFKNEKIYKNRRTSIKNTITHELTHYIQYMNNNEHHDVHGDPDVNQDFIDLYDENAKDVNSRNIDHTAFFYYIVSEDETEARISGFYDTVTDDHDWLIKKATKKGEWTMERVYDVVFNAKKYDKNELHIQTIENMIQMIEDDDWTTYKKCLDTADIRIIDSIVYCLLRYADECIGKPNITLPSETNYLMNVTTEEDFYNYKKELLKCVNEYLEDYKEGIKEIIDRAFKDFE